MTRLEYLLVEIDRTELVSVRSVGSEPRTITYGEGFGNKAESTDLVVVYKRRERQHEVVCKPTARGTMIEALQ